MARPKLLALTALFSLLLLGLGAVAVSALAYVWVAIPGTYGFSGADTCADGNSWLNVEISLTGTTDDTSGYDEFAGVTYDGDGNVLDVDLNTITAGTTGNKYDSGDPGVGEFGNPVSRPFKYVVYDIPAFSPADENTYAAFNWIVANGTPMSSTTFDPSFDPGCAGLPVAGAFCISIPDGSVVGDLPFRTQAFYSPGKISPDVFLNPGTYWVIGQDDAHEYYKIVLSCQYLWVPVNVLQLSYQAPQNGAPLPTRVVD